MYIGWSWRWGYKLMQFLVLGSILLVDYSSFIRDCCVYLPDTSSYKNLPFVFVKWFRSKQYFKSLKWPNLSSPLPRPPRNTYCDLGISGICGISWNTFKLNDPWETKSSKIFIIAKQQQQLWSTVAPIEKHSGWNTFWFTTEGKKKMDIFLQLFSKLCLS